MGFLDGALAGVEAADATGTVVGTSRRFKFVGLTTTLVGDQIVVTNGGGAVSYTDIEANSISFDSDEAATTGTIRFDANDTIKFLDGGSLTIDVTALSFPSDVTTLGDQSNGNGVDIEGVNSSKPIRLKIGGVVVAAVKSTGLEFGAATVASTGLLRFANNVVGMAWDKVGAGNVVLGFVDTNDDLALCSGSRHVLYDVATGGVHKFHVNGAPIGNLQYDATYPLNIVGASNVQVSAPGGYMSISAPTQLNINTGNAAVSVTGGFYVEVGGVAKFGVVAAGTSLGTTVGSFGGGTDVVFIANRSVAPSSNPVGGGILYCEAGALKYRGSSGTVVTLAVA